MSPGRTQNEIKKEDPWSSSLEQPDPELTPMKVEEQEVWVSQSGGQEAAYTKRMLYTVVTVKTEDNEEKHQCIRLYEIKAEDSIDTEHPLSFSATQTTAEPDESGRGGLEPAWSPDSKRNLQTAADKKPSHPWKSEEKPQDLQVHQVKAEDEYSSSDMWMKTETRGEDCGGPEPDGKPDPHHRLQQSIRGTELADNNETDDYYFGEPQSDFGSNTDDCNPDRMETSETDPVKNNHLESCVHTRQQAHISSHCGKIFFCKSDLDRHLKRHMGEKPFGCVICGKRFKLISNLTDHVRNCGKKFNKMHRETHMSIHREKNQLAVMIVKDYFAKISAI